MSLPTLVITSPGEQTRAELVPDANLLCASLRHRDAELLDAGRGVEAYAQRGKTMGIPLLYPWANRLSAAGYTAAGRTVTLPDPPDGAYPVDPNGLPIHGAVPGRLRWEVVDRAADRLDARLAWEGEALLTLFPFRHHVEVQAQVSDGALTLTTTVHADGADPVPVSFGYHPYLTLPGSDRSGWRITLGARERLALDERMIPTGATVTLAAAERDLVLGPGTSFDDGYTALDRPSRFTVADAARTVTVTFDEGYDWAQVYAPPGHDYVCFEPMTAPTNALGSGTGLTVLAPGESHRAAFTIAVTQED